MSLHWSNQQHTNEKILPSNRVLSADDLLCDEVMLDSESDLSQDSIEGTELLQIQLKARADQIFRSLGVSEFPNCKSRPVPIITESAVVTEESDVALTPENYAAEVVFSADGNFVQDVTEIHRPSDTAQEADVVWRSENEILVDNRHQNGYNREAMHYASSNTCSITSFDGTTPPEPSPASVKIHVCPISDSRVLIKYPKYSSSPTEYVHLDVTFPNGATDEVVNSYVENDVARFILEKKSDFSSDVPVSVTVVKDDKLLPSADKEVYSSSKLIPATLDEHICQAPSAARLSSATQEPLDRSKLLSSLQSIYDELDSKLCIAELLLRECGKHVTGRFIENMPRMQILTRIN